MMRYVDTAGRKSIHYADSVDSVQFRVGMIRGSVEGAWSEGTLGKGPNY